MLDIAGDGGLKAALQNALSLYSFTHFTPEQEELIRASVQGRDVLGVLRTGNGKSACYQVPGIILRQRTLVISPLIALQENQVRELRDLGIKAWALHSNMDDARKGAVRHYYKVAKSDEPSFLYISPELLLTEMFHETFDHVGFNRLAVDEAHCCSTWGDSFRPDYQRIAVASRRLKIPHCSAFTATVDKKIEADIRKRIPLRPDFLKVSEDPMRPNLKIAFERMLGSNNTRNPRALFWERFGMLTRQLKDPRYEGPVIVYWNSKDGVTRLYDRIRHNGMFLRETGYTPYVFHADLPYEDKAAALSGFLNDAKPLVIATSAFGMGINRKDVRQIIHYRRPRMLIEYAQQIGRGGRDGEPALCTTFIGTSDNDEFELERVSWDAPTYEGIERVLTNLRRSVGRIVDPVRRRRYNISSFRTWMVKHIKESEQILNKSTYETRFLTSLALLQRVNLIQETKDGLVVHDIEPGGVKQKKLIELTMMHERMLVREQKRVQRFFSSPEPDQQVLWEILSEKD